MKNLTACVLVLLVVLPCAGQKKEDVPSLIKQLKDPDEGVRLKAAKGLGKLGADATDAIEALTVALKDPDEDVRNVAKAALEKIKGGVKQTEQAEALAALAKVLVKVKSEDAKERSAAVEGLMKLLKNSDEIIRMKAAQALGEGGLESKSAVKDLDEAAKDADEGVRKQARKEMDLIQVAVAKELKGRTRQELAPYLKAMTDKAPAVRLKALEEIGAMGEKAVEASDALVLALMENSPVISEAAMDAIEKVNPALHKPLLTIVVDRSMQNKKDAISSLGKLGGDAKPTIPFLLRVYASHSHYYGGTILTVLNEIDREDKRVVNTILNAISISATSFNPGKRTEANNSELRWKGIELALALLKDSKVEGKAMVKPLLSALNDRRCRLQAIKALGTIGVDAQEAIPALNTLKRDANAETRDAATEALKKIQ